MSIKDAYKEENERIIKQYNGESVSQDIVDNFNKEMEKDFLRFISEHRVR